MVIICIKCTDIVKYLAVLLLSKVREASRSTISKLASVHIKCPSFDLKQKGYLPCTKDDTAQALYGRLLECMRNILCFIFIHARLIVRLKVHRVRALEP